MVRFPYIRVVEASAGSGKTWQLTQRFIHLLFKSKLQHILAITFTNKAANEMKERILEWLKKSTLGDEKIINEIKSSDTLQVLSGISERIIKERSKEKIQEIFQDYLNFNVRTIDSFINSIASSSSLEIGLPPNYEIIMNPLPYIKYVIDLILSKVGIAGADETILFDRFIESFLTLEERKSWQPKATIQENVNNLRKKENIRGLRFEKFSGRASKEEILEMLKKEKLNVSKKRMLEAIDKTIATKELERMENWIDDLSPNTKRKMEEYFYNTSSMRFNSYISILERVRSEIEDIKKRKRIVFIDDLGIKINEFLEGEGVVPEIYVMLGETIFHYLIDEFQDTNRIEWDNLQPLIENSLAQAGSLFYVGDKKQALYRFRGGDVDLFDRVRRDFPSVAGVDKPITLKDNFRSRENIVKFNNRIFSMENLKKIDCPNSHLDSDPSKIWMKIEKIYGNCEQRVSRPKDSEGGYISIKKIEKGNKKEILENLKNEMIPKLENVVSRYGFGDIAILVEENEYVRSITHWLIEKGWPVASEVTLDLRKNSFVNEIVSFLRFLNSPADDLSFASFISGTVFTEAINLGREKILSFLEDNRDRKTILYIIFRENYPELWKEYINPFFTHVGFLPLYDLVFEIFKVYKIFEKIPENEGFFMRLLEIINERDDAGENSLQAFLDYWNEGENEDFQITLPEHLNAIKISTIHKAKGLSFPVVLVAFIAKPKSMHEFIREEGKKLVINYITKRGNYPFSNRLKEIYDKEMDAHTLDSLNSLYVALTRAEDELFIFISSDNTFSCLFDEEEIGKFVRCEKEVSKERREYPPEIERVKVLGVEEVPVQMPVPLASPHWSTKLCRRKIEIETFIDLQRKKLIERGTFIHYVLASINKVEGNLEKIVEEKVMLGARETGFNGDTEEVKHVLNKIFSMKEVKEWFSFDGFNEKDIARAQARTGESILMRIDRFVILSDKIYIIEYKTGEEYSGKISEVKGEHLKQVLDYIDAVKEIYPDKKIEGYILYIDEEKVFKV